MIDVTGGEVIAAISSEKPHKERWTEVLLHHVPERRRPYIAETRGMTRVRGERSEVRRWEFKTLADAVDSFHPGALTDALKVKARSWASARRAAGAIAIEEERAFAATVGFKGPGGLAGAIAWLYPDGIGQPTYSDGERVQALAEHFAVPESTVRHALKREADGEGLTGWARAFLSAMLFFDRRSFHLVGGRRDGR